MSAMAFDTLRFTKTLMSVGIQVEHAEGIAVAFRDASSDADLLTKKDLALAVAQLQGEMNTVKGEVGLVKWMTASLMALALANFAKQYF